MTTTRNGWCARPRRAARRPPRPPHRPTHRDARPASPAVGIIAAMRASWRGSAPWVLGWAALSLADAATLVRVDIAQRRDAFETDARIAHRLLSQRAAQHDAILATLVLLAPAADPTGRDALPEQRLPTLHPQVLAVQRRTDPQAWPDPALADADARSRAARTAVTASVDAGAGRFVLVLAGSPSSFALHVDANRMVPWETWPLERDGPVSAALVHGGAAIVLQTGSPRPNKPAGLTPGFTVSKTLDSPSQPFELRLRRAAGPAQWPWTALLRVDRRLGGRAGRVRIVASCGPWPTARRVAAAARPGRATERDGRTRRRRRARARHQVLAATLANAQAARRLLDDHSSSTSCATRHRRPSRRAAPPTWSRGCADWSRHRTRRRASCGRAGAAAARRAPSCSRRSCGGTACARACPARARRCSPTRSRSSRSSTTCSPMRCQALQDVPVGERTLHLACSDDADRATGTIVVRDSGPGLSPAALERPFEPFRSTRPGGLGLGLSLSESLVRSMGGTLVTETPSRAAPNSASCCRARKEDRREPGLAPDPRRRRRRRGATASRC